MAKVLSEIVKDRKRQLGLFVTHRMSTTANNRVNRKCRRLLERGFSYHLVAFETGLTRRQVERRAINWDLKAGQYRNGKTIETADLLERVDKALGDAADMRREIQRIVSNRR